MSEIDLKSKEIMKIWIWHWFDKRNALQLGNTVSNIFHKQWLDYAWKQQYDKQHDYLLYLEVKKNQSLYIKSDCVP